MGNDPTNVWDAVVTVFAFLYFIGLMAGTAYLVQKYDWSPWWFLLAICLVPSIKTGTAIHASKYKARAEKLERAIKIHLQGGTNEALYDALGEVE